MTNEKYTDIETHTEIKTIQEIKKEHCEIIHNSSYSQEDIEDILDFENYIRINYILSDPSEDKEDNTKGDNSPSSI